MDVLAPADATCADDHGTQELQTLRRAIAALRALHPHRRRLTRSDTDPLLARLNALVAACAAQRQLGGQRDAAAAKPDDALR